MPDSGTCYVVMGETGEGRDYYTWPVKVFISEETAWDFKDSCMKEAKRLERKYPSHEKRWERGHSLDLNYSSDWNGTKYYIKMIELDKE